MFLEGDEARHLCLVRRIGVGRVVELFDGEGFATCARVVALRKDRVELQALESSMPERAPLVHLTLATAVPKGDRFDWLVEKATESGVSCLIPLLTERSVIDPRRSKLERLGRTVIEAAKQCGRNRLMKIEAPTLWVDLLTRFEPGTVRLLAHPGGRTFAQWPRPQQGGRAVLAIGPEGGFTEPEVQIADHKGWETVGLGTTLLRIETAALTAIVRLLALAESWTTGEG
ncbi:MAG: 16S rRNA (uracil(1498)-N(3))-methyltransferase [Isosphaeraceae bacterium]